MPASFLQMWSLRGECLATLAGATLPASAVNLIYVSESQEALFIYCPPEINSSAGNSSSGGNSSSSTSDSRPAAAGPQAPEADGLTESGRGVGAGGASASSGSSAAGQGCIRVYDLLRGCQVALVQQAAPAPGSGCATQGARQAAVAALRHISALFYDEDTHRLYTGSADGRVQAWGL